MTEETHAEFMTRMRQTVSATKRHPGLPRPDRRYAQESLDERKAKLMARDGYGWEDLAAKCRSLSKERCREIVFWRRKPDLPPRRPAEEME